jgi:diguanylate cyclase (GGDEF)-like protein
VLNGQVDVAVQSDLKINELTVYDQYKELQNLKYIPGNYVASFCVNTDDELLVGILDKALNSITESTLSTIVNNNIRHIAIQQMSLWDMIQQYKGYIIMAIVLLITLTYTYSSYRKFKEEQRQKDLAYHDSIADIGSMQKFKIDVEPILQGHEKEDYYLLTIDIDKFKVINDLYGYEEGDRVIRFLAGKIKAGLTSEDYVTRNHADNFVVLKHGYSLQEVEIYLEKLFRSVEKTLEERQSHYNMIIKAGIYRLEDEDVNLSGIIDKANMAKENIREGHQSSYQNYAEDMRQKTLYTKKIENQMEEALEQGQFCVYLQPQIDLKTKQIVSAEALVRWIHPEDGIIPPDNFIPIFEKNGFINKLDEFVWEQSIKTVAKWHDQHMIAVPVAINFSRVDVLKEGMVDKLFAMMDKYELDSQWIKTELTESVCLDNDSVVMEKMHMLKNFGLKIAVDDFGSGYSSLHLLKKMPVDILKIDKSFLDFTPGENSRGEIVIRDVVEMGKDLDLQIIIEGVETKEQSDFMESIGCDIVQGYFYGRPMPIPDFEQKLRENRMAGGAMA